jgi:DNA (cytosine-5)-methyltransferase 1
VAVRDDLQGFPVMPKGTYTEDHYRSTRWAIEDLEGISDDSIPNQSQYFRASRAKKGNGQGDETTSADSPSYTIRANAKSRVQFHYSLDRRLTVRECARLQTFPDTFEFPHSATSNIMQIGNAVPPILGNKVARAIAKYLEEVK